MTKLADMPAPLRPYAFHGVELAIRGDEALGDCPFCGREGKFSVEVTTGRWRCLVCGTGSTKGGGNSVTFLRVLWELGAKATRDYGTLPAERGLLDAETLRAWGVVKSLTTNNWLVPGYNAEGKLCQLYRYLRDAASGKYRLLATPELPQQLHGVNLFDPKKKEVYVCEGPWDAMALWEVLKGLKPAPTGEEGFRATANSAASLLAGVNVLAVPGCNTFLPAWGQLAANKDVVLLYDSDHAKKTCANCKTSYSVVGLQACPKCKGTKTAATEVPPGGYVGVRRVTTLLAVQEAPPTSIRYLKWGPEGYDPELPSGYDLRDALKAWEELATRGGAWAELAEKIQPIPAEWVAGRSKEAAAHGNPALECKFCNEWKVLVQAWRKALRWTEGLDRALSVMLAVVTSTRALGDQLWVKVVGPASCGKSTLCEALSINKKYVIAKSTIRGFHSGYKSDRTGVEDHSLITSVKDRTLVTKDGDTLMKSPNIDQILSEARDLYDCTARTHYRHGLTRDYDNVRMTWILCGTSSIRSLDSSELGERFLDCVIMEGIDENLEDEILLRVAHKAERNLSLEANGVAVSQADSDESLAKQLTGGYVTWLRENAQRLLDATHMGQDALQRCIALGKFVAYMRARPSKTQGESAEREFGARLVTQHVRLAKCLAVVLNRPSVDEEVMRRVTRVATDTARGKTLEIVRELYRCGDDGADVRSVAVWVHGSEVEQRKLLNFLVRIGAAERFSRKVVAGVSRIRFRLATRMRELYARIVQDAADAAATV